MTSYCPRDVLGSPANLTTAPEPGSRALNPSPHPVRKYVERVASLDIEEYPEWDLTKSLPRLPVPRLEDTLAKYLLCVRPVVSAEQYERTRQQVEEFGRPGGQGHILQQKLLKYTETKDNWATDMWLDDMYMKNPLPLPINSNPAMVFPRMSFDDVSDQLRFAARLISAILDYKSVIDSRSLPVDRARSREKGQPLCMEQYYRLFTSYRVPGLQKDVLATSSGSLSPQPEHIIVACKNQFFVLDTMANYTRLTNDMLYAQLKRIVQMAEEEQGSAQPVGVLTTAPRPRWARARAKLMEEDSVNRDNLDLIERCMFVVCLDKSLPLSFNHQHSIDETKRMLRDDVSMCKQMMHGHGSSFNTCNRWMDKTMQFVIGADGSCGLCYEHSPAEGIAITQLIEHLLKYMEEVRRRKLARMQSICDLACPKKLRWRLSDELVAEVKDVIQETDKMINNTDLYVLRFDDYGKNFPKQMNMSPDAYMQLALQLTFYRIHGRLVPTYESASIRRFRSGRVDNIRACTLEALNWVKSMVAQPAQPKEQSMKLLRAAIKRQTDILVQTILGHGIDNHLLGLRQMAEDNDIPAPGIFTDPSYKMSNQFTLSTSQVPSSLDTLTCYGPVVPDGYGACYNLQPDFIVVCVTSFNSCGDTKSDNFAGMLETSLQQMQELCLMAREEPGPSTYKSSSACVNSGDLSSEALTNGKLAQHTAPQELAAS